MSFQPVDMEEQCLVGEDQPEVQPVAAPANRSLKKAGLMMLGLGVVATVCFGGLSSSSPAKVHFASAPYMKQLHRASRIISLYQHFNQLTKDGQSAMENVAHSVNEVYETEQFKHVGKDAEKGGQFANYPPMKDVSQLGFTEDKLRELHGMFNMVDGDRDGEFSFAELQAVFTRVDPGTKLGDLRAAWKELGPERENPSWLVSFREFANFEAYRQTVEGDNTNVDKVGNTVRELIDEYDTGHDGELSHIEISHMLVMTLPPLPHGLPVGVTIEDVIANLFTLFDANSDGKLDQAELTSLVKAMD